MDSRKENYQKESYPRHIPTQRIRVQTLRYRNVGCISVFLA